MGVGGYPHFYLFKFGIFHASTARIDANLALMSVQAKF
jgi:hypothetical protein